MILDSLDVKPGECINYKITVFAIYLKKLDWGNNLTNTKLKIEHTNFSGRIVLELWCCPPKRWMTESSAELCKLFVLGKD